MKKNLKLAILMAAALAVLTACGSDSSSSATEAATAAPTEATAAAEAEAPAEQKSEAEWPTGDVTFIVPANAGGGTDMVARLVAGAMEDYTGKNFVIVNDTTGQNTVAYETVRNADPDGLTLLFYHAGICSQMAMGQYAQDLDSFTIVGNCNDVEKYGLGVYVNANSPFNTFEDLVDYAREHPGDLICGVESNGTDHLAAVLMMQALDFDMTIVSAGSNTEKLPLLMGENIDVCLLQPNTVSDYVESGDIKCLAICGTEETAALPDTQTLREMGYDWDCLDLLSNMFLAGPAGMSDELVDEIYAALEYAYEDEDVQAGLAQMDMAWTLEPTEDVRDEFKSKLETYKEAYALLDAAQ